MKIKQKFRQVLATLLSVAMIMTLCVGLNFGAITVEATNYSNQTWYITTDDDGTIQSVNFQFRTSDTADGTWYLYLWDKNDTSGTNGRPQILSSAFQTTSDGSHSMTINYDCDHGKEYLIGMVLKDSKWSTGNTSGSEYLDWPYLTNVCDMVDCDDNELAGAVYVNSELVSGSVSDSLKTEENTSGSTDEEETAGDTVLMEGFTTSVDEETGVITISNVIAKNGGTLYYVYMSESGIFKSDVDETNEMFDNDPYSEYFFADQFEKVTGNSVTISMTGNDPYIVMLCELHEGIKNDVGATYGSRVIYLYFANGNDASGEEVPTYTIKLDASKFTGSYIIGYGDDINGDQQYLRSGGAIEIPTDGTVTISATEAFTAVADGATVGELNEGEGLFRIISNFTKDTTIVINPDPSDNGNTGDITNDTNPEENECNADLDLTDAEVEDVIELTTDDEQAIANGDDISIILEVENADDTVADDDKTATENALEADMEIGMYLDITLLKKVGNNNPTAITETKQPITITFAMPDELINPDATQTRTYKIIRVHNGVTTLLDCNFNSRAKTASFETDKFSSYAIAYVDTANNNNDDNNNENKPSYTIVPNPISNMIIHERPEQDNDEDEDVSSAAGIEAEESIISGESIAFGTMGITLVIFAASIIYTFVKRKEQE